MPENVERQTYFKATSLKLMDSEFKMSTSQTADQLLNL